MTKDTTTCPTCGGPLIQKNKAVLLLAGIIFIVLGGVLIYFLPQFWPATIFLFLIGTYLITWSTLAKGLWCRQCKSIPLKR